jgi:hypothetical protein
VVAPRYVRALRALQHRLSARHGATGLDELTLGRHAGASSELELARPPVEPPGAQLATEGGFVVRESAGPTVRRPGGLAHPRQ